MKKTLTAFLYGMVGALVTLVMVLVVSFQNRPDLKLWHMAHLDAAYHADSQVSDFKGYLAQEDALFHQLQSKVLDRLPAADRGPINRYHRGSLTDPDRWKRNWNRTFELTAEEPVAGILLLHGMSDSPYSLRTLGQELNENGAWVLGLRLPGHGTIPSGLIEVTWEDMAAAVRLAMQYLRERVGDKPLFMVGYSTGGALSLEYALAQMDDADHLPAVSRIVLISPAVGVSRMAALAVWQGRLGRWLGIDTLSWNSIQPEYNSYKYNSFAINAGEQVFRLTTFIQKRLKIERQTGRLAAFPPVLTFQSVADATVSTAAVFTGLYHQLLNPGNELVVFDINRHAGVDSLLVDDPLASIRGLMAPDGADYRLSLVTNENPQSDRVVEIVDEDGPGASRPRVLAWNWPAGVHSLSHIALPFPQNDPLYGNSDTTGNPGISLGKITLRGERGVICIPADEILRLRWNPFYPYLKQRVVAFLFD